MGVGVFRGAGEVTGEIARGVGWELRCGRYQDVLADVERVDAVVTDPPYSERTHAAQISAPRDPVAALHGFAALEYRAWSEAEARDAAGAWARLASGWCVVFSDHALQRVYESAFEDSGRYVFAPLAQTTLGRSVRLAGDGPATWTTWITVARPRSMRAWGALPGAYVDGVGDRIAGEVRGAKQVALMRAIIRDYTRPGDLVCDPCAGGGTTLLAAVLEGRRAIGAEMDPSTFAKAVKRLEGVTAREVYDPGNGIPRARQQTLGF
jgi:site-specific DNA-methyltransferase (adenine-specific)